MPSTSRRTRRHVPASAIRRDARGGRRHVAAGGLGTPTGRCGTRAASNAETPERWTDCRMPKALNAGRRRRHADDDDDDHSDRRSFTMAALAAAGATYFGKADAVGAQTPAPSAAGAPPPPASPAPPPLALGNGEPLASQFQPWPGGTGALFERLLRERGVAAFARAPHVPPAWSGTMPTADEDLAFLPAHRLSALLRARKVTSTRLTRDLPRAAATPQPDAELRRDAARDAGARRGTQGRCGDRRRPLSRAAARRAVRPQGPLLDQGHSHDLGRARLQGSGHRRGRGDRRAPPGRRRGPGRQAVDRHLRAERSVVRRPHQQPVEPVARVERVVSGTVIGGRRRLCRVRDRHGDAGVDRVAGDPLRHHRAAADVRPCQPLRRHGARLVARSRRADVPHRRGLRDGLQRAARRRREGPVDGDDAVPLRPSRRSRAPSRRRRSGRAEGTGGEAA